MLTSALLAKTTLQPGTLFIPNNIFQMAVLGEDQISSGYAHKKVSLTAQKDSIVFEISKESFKEYLQMNPGTQLALKKFSWGIVP